MSNALPKAPRVPPSPNSLAAAFDRRAAIGAAILGPIAVAACISDPVHAATEDRWRIALSDYRRKRAISDAVPLGTAGEDDAVDAWYDAMVHLIEVVPAPDAEALAIKMRLAREQDGLVTPDEWWRAFIADAERLSQSREG